MDPDGWPEPALIFGQREKLQAAGPFLALLAEFEAQLSKSQTRIVVGYSSRDAHVNELIQRWAAEDQGAKIIVVDPFWGEGSRPRGDFRTKLENHLRPQDWPGAPRFASRLEIIKEKASKGIQQLVPG